MILYINTSSNKKTIVRLGDKELVKDSSVRRSQVVLPMIAKLTKDPKKITGISVVTSGESFTGVRVGTAIANTLGYALGVPVNGQKFANVVYNIPHLRRFEKEA